jgi:hypothetical protein
MDKDLKRLDPHAPDLVPDDLLGPDSSDPDEVTDLPPSPGDPPSKLEYGPREPPVDGGAGLSTSGASIPVLSGGFRDDFVSLFSQFGFPETVVLQIPLLHVLNYHS